MLDKKFIRGFILYLVIVIGLHVLCLYILGGIGMANDISNEERQRYSAPLVFIIHDLFGFPLSLFLPYEILEATQLSAGLVLIFLVNCLIQFSILSFLWRLLKRR